MLYWVVSVGSSVKAMNSLYISTGLTDFTIEFFLMDLTKEGEFGGVHTGDTGVLSVCVGSEVTLVGDRRFAAIAIEPDPELLGLTREGEFGGVHTGNIVVLLSGSWHWGSTPDCVGLSKVMSPTASVT